MPTYFASDIHLRTDYPERGARFARWVRTLRPGQDPLYLVGDLCDFWFESRQRRGLELPCDGLRALADFVARGGELIVLPGNHDAWLGDYYREALGARYVPEGQLDLECGGRRLLVAHGHLLGARSLWKHAMESRAFLEGFRALPGSMAATLAGALDRNNEARLDARHAHYLELYRREIGKLAGTYDLAVLGHVHQTADFQDMTPRLIVLGDWTKRSSYLRIDDSRIDFVIEG